MTTRVLVGSLIGTVILMIWGFVFWTLLPNSQSMIRVIDGEDEVLEVLDRNIAETGVYFVPLAGMYDESTRDRFEEKHKRGPIARISFRKEGVDAASPVVFIKGFFHFFVSVLFLCGIVAAALPRLTTYRSRLFFIFFVGVFAAFFTHLSDAVWMHVPLKYALYYADFHVIGWLFVGLALAAIIKPREV